MGTNTGFMELLRIEERALPIIERVKHYREFVLSLSNDEASRQGARCMDCGIPFCQSGCPIHNIIPDWNDLVYRKDWQQALEVLHSTNNFPEFTGRVCPAPCEAACTLNINNDPVGIKSIERFIIDKAWQESWVTPQPARRKTRKKVAIIGSGPAGLACAQQLARVGHQVIVFEKSDRIGGLLRYGIPDFKMEKSLIDRRLQQMRAEGVVFETKQHIGVTGDAVSLVRAFDAVVLACGAERPRDLPVAGRQLSGVHFAMDYLPQQNKVVAGDQLAEQISAAGKRVVVIGGGDTGSDCVGTANRQGARSVTQFELLPQPPELEDKSLTWPYWPIKLRTSSSHEEGCARDWAVVTKRFAADEADRVKKIIAARLIWQDGVMQEIPGSEFAIEADLVLLAMGFLGPERTGLLEQLAPALDDRSNVKANSDDYQTSLPKVFAAGDIRRGQSLVVWAIREGRQCARAVDRFLMGTTYLPV